MMMMTPERQLVNPFFTGGETLSISYPTNTMGYEEKLMSMRGNNPAFSRATVHHELIAGHHLQGYMSARNKVYRSDLLGTNTPFWGEGSALYWELAFVGSEISQITGRQDRDAFLENASLRADHLLT
jgi:hypothetical protein